MGRVGWDRACESVGAWLGPGATAGLSDGQLVERFAARGAGEVAEGAFAALVARHGPMVRRVCGQVLRHEADADDAFQAVFLVLARRAGSIRDPELLAPWLHGVALRTARLARRRDWAGLALDGEPPAAPVACPAEGRESAEALHEEVGRLPEGQRRAVVLCHLQGLTHEEAATRLGVPTGTVSVRLMRARERLRTRLTRRGFAPGALFFPRPAAVGATAPRAWAALNHLRGVAAGEVPVRVASLAAGALPTMSSTFLKIAAVLVTGTLAASGTAWSLAQAPALGRTDAPQAAPPAAVRPSAEDPALVEFRRVYRLDPGQVVKRIPPPFAPWRTADLYARSPSLKESTAALQAMIYEEKGGVLDGPSTFFDSRLRDQGRWVADLLDDLLGLRFPQVEGPDDLRQTPVTGDWIVAAGSPLAERVAALNVILKDECRSPICLRLHDAEREVIVARGRFRASPVLAGDEAIQFYGATLTPNGGSSGYGDFTGFLGWLGRFVEPRRCILDEVEGRPTVPLSWHQNYRTPDTEATFRQDHADAAVLRHVAEQTGLSFTPERRVIPVLTVERAD